MPNPPSPSEAWGSSADEFVGTWADESNPAQDKPKIVIESDPLQVSFLNDSTVPSQGNPYAAQFTPQCTIEVPVSETVWVIAADGYTGDPPKKSIITSNRPAETQGIFVPTEGERYTEEDT